MLLTNRHRTKQNPTKSDGDNNLVTTRNVGQCPTWWSPCRIYVAPSVRRRKVWLTPTTRCCAVTLPTRETSWNLQGYPKLVNRSQPLVGWSSPYCGDMWRTYCCLTSFFSDCRYVPQLRRYSPTKLCDGAQMAIFGDFLCPVFSAIRVQQVSDLHLKFALRPHHVWKYGRHPICGGWD